MTTLSLTGEPLVDTPRASTVLARFAGNRLALTGAVLLLLMVLFSFVGPLI